MSISQLGSFDNEYITSELCSGSLPDGAVYAK